MRHAEAMPRPPASDDQGRELTSRGHADARTVGGHLLELGQVPERVLCSTARRTRQTWTGLSEVWSRVGHFPIVQYADTLYGADEDRLLDELIAVDAGCEHLMVLAHNPGVHRLALELARAEVTDTRPLERLRERMAPGTAVILEFDQPSWVGLRRGSGTVIDIVRPQDLAVD